MNRIKYVKPYEIMVLVGLMLIGIVLTAIGFFGLDCNVAIKSLVYDVGIGTFSSGLVTTIFFISTVMREREKMQEQIEKKIGSFSKELTMFLKALSNELNKMILQLGIFKFKIKCAGGTPDDKDMVYDTVELRRHITTLPEFYFSGFADETIKSIYSEISMLTSSLSKEMQSLTTAQIEENKIIVEGLIAKLAEYRS